MSKHTPGPWFFDQHGHVYGTSEAQPIDGFPGGKTILHPHVCTPRCISDARLIAAAPELLAVSDNWEVSEKEDGIWLILRGTGTTGRGAFRVARPGSRTIAVQVLRLLDADRRAAIAKATGGEE